MRDLGVLKARFLNEELSTVDYEAARADLDQRGAKRAAASLHERAAILAHLQNPPRLMATTTPAERQAFIGPVLTYV